MNIPCHPWNLYRVYTCDANRAGPAQFTRTVPSAVLARVYTTISVWGRGLSHVTDLDRNLFQNNVISTDMGYVSLVAYVSTFSNSNKEI